MLPDWFFLMTRTNKIEKNRMKDFSVTDTATTQNCFFDVIKCDVINIFIADIVVLRPKTKIPKSCAFGKHETLYFSKILASFEKNNVKGFDF